MRRALLLAALALALPAAAWAATFTLEADTLTVVDEPVRIEIASVPAAVKITPSTFERRSAAHTLKAHVDLPDAFDATTVPASSIFLCAPGGCIGTDSVSASGHHVEAVFDGDGVLALVPNGDVTLRVSGVVGSPPATWSGTDVIRVTDGSGKPSEEPKEAGKGDDKAAPAGEPAPAQDPAAPDPEPAPPLATPPVTTTASEPEPDPPAAPAGEDAAGERSGPDGNTPPRP